MSSADVVQVQLGFSVQLVLGWPSSKNMYCTGSVSVSEAVAVKVTAAPATCGLARSETRSVTTGGLFGGALMTKSVVLELSPSGLCLLSLTLASIICCPICSLVAVQIQTGLSDQSCTTVPSKENWNCRGSLSASMNSTVQEIIEPVSWGLCLSGLKLMMAGFWLGDNMTNVALLLSSNPSCSACFPSLTWTSIWASPSAAVQAHLLLDCQSVVGSWFKKNLYKIGFFSGSDALAVQVTMLPVSWGLFLSAANSEMTGFSLGLFMVNFAFLDESPSILCDPSRTIASILWTPISLTEVVQVH